MKLVTIAALGFALVVGIVVGGRVGNPLGASAQSSATTYVVTATDEGNASARCDPGDPVTGGGFRMASYGQSVWRSEPLIEADSEGWFVVGNVTADTTAYAVCLDNPPYHGAGAVGGIAEPPPLAGTGGSGVGGATYAVLAGAAAGMLAFAVLATLSVKRRGVR